MTNNIEELLQLTKENNYMLKQIIAYINSINRNADNENSNDFIRNILANLISNTVDYNKVFNIYPGWKLWRREIRDVINELEEQLIAMDESDDSGEEL